MDWDSDGIDWPNRNASRFITAAGLHWHCQQFAPTAPAASIAPLILLLHGTGSSAHSWRAVAPLLATRFRVLAPDLPGHAFTSLPSSLSAQSLPGMARHVAGLLSELGATPDLIVGHSAGAAIAAQMVLSGEVKPASLVSLNGAFLGFGGLAGALFPPLARLMASVEMTARLVAWQARDPALVHRLVRGTGSVLDEAGMATYARLLKNPGHVRAALGMMAHWDLASLGASLPKLRLPVWLVAAANDLTVPPSQASQVASMLPQPVLRHWPGLGHLAHEENPALCAQLIDEAAVTAGIA